jgi:hypothetical protein
MPQAPAPDLLERPAPADPEFHPLFGTLGAKRPAGTVHRIPTIAPGSAPVAEGAFLTEEEFSRQFMKADRREPVSVLFAAVLLGFAAQVILALSGGAADAGAVAASYAAAMFVLVAIGLLAVLAVGRMFVIDMGSAPSILLRLAAVYSVADLIPAIGATLAPPAACWALAIIATLVMLKLAFGLDLLQLVVVAVLTWAIKVLVICFLIGPLTGLFR